MTTLVVEISDQDKDFFLEVVKRFNGKIVDNSKKQALILGIKQGLKEAKEIEAGEKSAFSLKDI